MSIWKLGGDGDKPGIKGEPVNAARPYKNKTECPDVKSNHVVVEDAVHLWPQTHLRRSVLFQKRYCKVRTDAVPLHLPEAVCGCQ